MKHRPYRQTLKNIIGSIAAVCVAAIPSACELEASHNGKLDGMWHLERVDTLATGGVNDLSRKKLFWSFQGKLLQLDDKERLTEGFYMRFNHTADGILVLSEPYLNERTKGDEKIDSAERLAPYAVNATEEQFAVEQLTNSSMTLKSETLRIRFTKF